MNVAISLRLATEDWEQGSAYVVEAERLGAHSVWTPEAWGHDAVAPLAFLAARTSRILLGTAIMQAGTRTPALRSEEHTSELQSRSDLVCRLLLEKKK